MNDLTDRIDVSLRKGRPIDDEVRPWLATLAALDPLAQVPPRAPEAMAKGLAAFLNEARSVPVSSAPPTRLPDWKHILFRKEMTPMNVLATIALMLTLTFSGAGVTAYAAQSSQPDEPLYGVKLATEDLRLGLSQDPQERLVLALNLVQVRTQEMAQLVQANRAVPVELQTRLQSHVNTALEAASELGDAALATASVQIRERSQAQLQAIAQLRALAPSDQNLSGVEAALTRLQTMAQIGADDPGQFRQHVRAGQLPAPTPTEAASSAAPATSQPTSTPLGAGHSYGPGDGTCQDGLVVCTPEQDGNSYGDGPRNPNVTPGAGPLVTQSTVDAGGYGPGPSNGGSNGNGQGGQPQVTPNPTQVTDPGGYGPGPQATATPLTNTDPVATSAPQTSCTPEQDGNSYGTGPGNASVTPSGDHNVGPTAQPGNGRP